MQTQAILRAVLSSSVILFVAGPVRGQLATMHGVYDSLTFPPVEPPATLSWEIATADNQRVALTITDIQPTPLGQPMQWTINQANASQYGVDWAAWQAAALNPAFTRSLLRFGDTTKEGPLVRNNFADGFVLGSFGVTVDDYVWPPDRLGFVLNPIVNAGAAGIQIVPEPGTSSLLFGCLLLFRFLLYSNARH